MPNIKNIKPPTVERKGGAVTKEEQYDSKKQAKLNLQKAKSLHKPVYFLEKNTHTGETIKRLVK
jgi:hypothetical protein